MMNEAIKSKGGFQVIAKDEYAFGENVILANIGANKFSQWARKSRHAYGVVCKKSLRMFGLFRATCSF